MNSTQPQSRRSVQRLVRRRWILYCLVENSSRVRYFGITTQKPGRRLLQHYADASRKRKDHKTNWIRRCVEEGIPIDIRVLKSNLVEAKAFHYEKRLIRFFGKAFSLVNTHEGGSSGYQGLSAEAKSRHLESTRKALAGRNWKALSNVMLAAKRRKRLAAPPPEYFDAPDYAKPVREIVYRDLLTGETHTFLLFIHPKRIDQFRCDIDCKPWLARAGWSRVLAGLRKAVPRFSQVNNS